MKRIIVLLLFIGFATACSTQNRDAYPQVGADELYKRFAEVQGGGTGDASLTSFSFDDLTNSNNNVLFHAAQSDGRPAASVFSVIDMSYFGGEALRSSEAGLDQVDVFFLDQKDINNQRVFTLALGFEVAGGPVQYFSASSQPDDYDFNNDAFATTLNAQVRDSSGVVHTYQFVVRSNDLSAQYNDELADSIKLDLYLLENGSEYYIGQISTMAGFGNR